MSFRPRAAERAAPRAVPLPLLPEAPTVSVVIPARESATTLPAAVASALAQDPKPDEVVVAVGPSQDDTWAVAQRLASDDPDRIHVVDNPAGRTPDALNAAIAASTGQVIARLDAHAELPPGYLRTAVATLRRTHAGNVGGLQVPQADDGFARCVAAAMRSPAGTGGASYRSGRRDGPVDTVYLGVFRREALEAVGGFDPVFVRNQDAELNLRLAGAGYAVWLEPELVVAYRPRGSLRSLARQYHGYGRWRRRTAATHPGSLQVRQLAAPVLVAGLAGAALVSVVTRRRWPFGLAAGGYLGAVGVAGGQAADDWRDAPGTAAALATMHLAWGVGFWTGPPRSDT